MCVSRTFSKVSVPACFVHTATSESTFENLCLGQPPPSEDAALAFVKGMKKKTKKNKSVPGTTPPIGRRCLDVRERGRSFFALHVHVFGYECSLHVCMYVRVWGVMYVCTYVRMYVCVYVCMHACMYACMYVCLYVCMYVCMNVCMYVCI